ncbi:MAG: caspase domain-containing protein, partial [Alphaproteobacteria bacterium]
MPRLAIALLLLLLSLTSAMAQERRIALVIGNTGYQHMRALPNAVNDAEALAGTLRGLGFAVTLERNQNAAAMRRTMRDFSDAARGADVALFFFAGHGLQMGTRDRVENYLVPVDARLSDARDTEDETIALSRVLQLLDGARARVVILDACRD